MKRTMHNEKATGSVRRMPLAPRKLAHNALAILLALSMVWWQTPVYAIADDGDAAQQLAAVIEEQPTVPEALEAPVLPQPEVVGEASEPAVPESIEVEEPTAPAASGGEELQPGADAAADQPTAADQSQDAQAQLADQGAGATDADKPVGKDADKDVDKDKPKDADEQAGEPFALRDLTEAVFVDEEKVEASSEDFTMTSGEKHDFWIVFKEKDGKQLPEKGKLSYKLPDALSVAAIDVDGMAVFAPESGDVARGIKADVKFELKNGDELVLTLAQDDSVYAGAIAGDGAIIAVRFKAEATRNFNLSDFGGTAYRPIVVETEGVQQEAAAPEAAALTAEGQADNPTTPEDAQAEAAQTIEGTAARQLGALVDALGIDEDTPNAPEYQTDAFVLGISWNDWDNAFGKRPKTVKIVATTTGAVPLVQEFEITAEDDWWIPVEVPAAPDSKTTFKFAGDDEAFTQNYNYNNRKTHSADDKAIWLSAPMKYVDYAVVQTWADQSDAAGLRPQASYITIYMDGQPFPIPDSGLCLGSSTTPSITSWPYRVGSPSGSTTTYTTVVRLPDLYHDDGTPVVYTASQDPVPYYDKTTEVRPPKQTRITNTFKKTISFTANMAWENDAARQQQRPSSVVLTLLANGEPYTGKDAVIEVNSTASKRVWNNLPAADAEGNPIVYSVTQSQLTIYDTSYDQTVADEDGNQTATVHNSRRDDWNYAIDLKWDTPDPAQKYHQETTTLYSTPVTAKYNLNISTNSRSYEPGEFEVRLPYYLWRGRNGDYIGPNAVSVPKAPEHNPGYAFNYTVDTHGTTSKADDEIVFVNWTKLPTATNITLPVSYEIRPRNTIDLSVAHLVATGYAKGDGQTDYEVQESKEITYRMDTGVTVTAVKKESAKAVYGDWRTGSDMRYSTRVIADDTCDHSQYDYVMYDIHGELGGNQPYKMVYKEEPGDGGEIVAYRYINGNDLKFEFDKDTNTWTAYSKNITRNQYKFDINSTSYNLLGGNYYDYAVRVLVRYPRDNSIVKPVSTPGGQALYARQYHNTFTVTAEAVDDEHEPDEWGPDRQDISTRSTTVAYDYYDYLFNWKGEIYRFTKSVNGLRDYGVTRVENGEDLIWNGSLTNIVNGYNFGTFGEESYLYQEELYDQDLYWNVTDAKGGGDFKDYKRLTEDDYYFNHVAVQVNLDDIDRATGEQYADTDYANEQFVVQARTQGGDWQEVERFTLIRSGTQWYQSNSNTSRNFTAEQGFVGLRIVSPDSLRGRTHIYFNFGITIKANSPMAQELARMEKEGPEFDKLYLMNIGSMKLYRNDGEGNYNWVNPVSPGSAAAQCDAAAGVGLSAEDVADPANGGNCVEHKYGVNDTGRVYYTDYSGKKTVSVVNDNVNSKVDVTFDIGAAEHIGLSTLPDSLYEEMSFDEGMFYDLLPRGYTYTEGSAIAHGAGQSFGSDANTAQVVSVETIDDYEGTGRQLVKFSVASGRDPGTNIAMSIGDIGMSNYYGLERRLTGFAVRYKASITWEALTYNRVGFNMMAYYDGADGQGREFKGTNSTPKSDANGYKIVDSRYFDGVQLIDANGNGSDRAKEVMYAYSYVNPQVLVPIETGITKMVRGVSGTFSKHDFTTIGGTYDYRIALHTSDNGKTSDIVLYDVLEEAANTGGQYGESSWKGVLSNVDTSVPSSQGIAPVVYYSTLQGIDYNDINDTDKNLTIDNAEVWSTTPPADMSQVTAIAVDLRKDKNGKAFSFDSNSSTSITLTMLAPTELPDPRFAYNRPAYHAVYTPYGSIPDPDRVYLNIGTRVSVELFTVDVWKAWVDRDDADGIRPDSVTVHVMADGVDTGRTVTLSQDNGWHYKFTDLPAITQKGETIAYTVEEEPVEGYQTEIEGNATDGFTITNSRASAELNFFKHYAGDAVEGKEYTFELAACDSEGTILEGDDAYHEVIENGEFVDGEAEVRFSTLFTEDGDYYFRVWEREAEGTTVGDKAAYLVHVKVEDHVAGDPEYTLVYPDANGIYQVVEEGVVAPTFYNNERTTRRMALRARPMALTGYTAAAERVSVYPQVEKVLDSPTGILVGGDYSFELLDAEGAVIATASNDENGHVAFYKEDAGELGLVFNAPGTYEYTIRERIPEGAHDNGDGTFTLDETIYDGSTITLKVDVQQVDGALEATCTYTDAEGVVLETPTFTNVQEGMDLVVYKVSRYGGEGLDKCTYALWMVGPNGDVMLREGTSDATGRIVFKDVVMSSAETYYFKEVEAPAGHTVDPYRTAYFTLNEEGTGTVLIEETADDGWHSKYDNIWIDQEKRAAEADAAAAAAGGAAGSTGLGDDAGAVSRDATPIKEG